MRSACLGESRRRRGRPASSIVRPAAQHHVRASHDLRRTTALAVLRRGLVRCSYAERDSTDERVVVGDVVPVRRVRSGRGGARADGGRSPDACPAISSECGQTGDGGIPDDGGARDAGPTTDAGPPPECTSDGDCDDGSGCTTDHRAAGTCVHQPLDGDGDGYVASCCGGDDCNDASPGVHPNVTDVCKHRWCRGCSSRRELIEPRARPLIRVRPIVRMSRAPAEIEPRCAPR